MTTLSAGSIDLFLKSIAAHGGSPNTVKAYGTDLRKWMEWTEGHHGPTSHLTIPLEEVGAEYLTAIRSEVAPTTLNRKLAAMKSWARWAGVGQDFLKDYRRPTPAPAVPHPLTEGIEGVYRMLAQVRRPAHEALIALQGLCGLRVSEALACQPSWFAFQKDGIWLTVVGKGDKTRRVPVSTPAWIALATAYAEATTRPQDPRIVALTDRAARRAITRIAGRAGLDGDTASHDLRATFATTAYRNSGNDVRAVQELMGHSNSSTTEIYIGNDDETLQSAVDFERRSTQEDED